MFDCRLSKRHDHTGNELLSHLAGRGITLHLIPQPKLRPRTIVFYRNERWFRDGSSVACYCAVPDSLYSVGLRFQLHDGIAVDREGEGVVLARRDDLAERESLVHTILPEGNHPGTIDLSEAGRGILRPIGSDNRDWSGKSFVSFDFYPPGLLERSYADDSERAIFENIPLLWQAADALRHTHETDEDRVVYTPDGTRLRLLTGLELDYEERNCDTEYTRKLSEWIPQRCEDDVLAGGYVEVSLKREDGAFRDPVIVDPYKLGFWALAHEIGYAAFASGLHHLPPAQPYLR